MVMLNREDQKPLWALEVKWSDRYCEKPGELVSILDYCSENTLPYAMVTSKTMSMSCKVKDVELNFIPASIYCYMVGYNLIRYKTHPMKPGNNQLSDKVETPAKTTPDIEPVS